MNSGVARKLAEILAAQSPYVAPEQRIGPTPKFVPHDSFHDPIYALPPAQGTQSLEFDQMGSPQAYEQWVVPRRFGR